MEQATVSFKARAERGLSDPALRSALRKIGERFGTNREKVMLTLPDAEEARDRARAIRRHTLAKLDRYLEEFVRNAEAAGTTVHWAANAEEANQTVVRLARERRADLVAKSKSMVSEETGLNAALQAAGITALECDLGEYILQLLGEPPTHIVAPMVHKTRADVSALFHEKFGMPYTDDVSALTQFARSNLRKRFLEAGMGFSGVNFGVAETGTLTIVTNEGNGRMVTSLPRYHVAMMGIERLVPTVEDLVLMLQLLARSATGQKLTVYTSMMTGPRRQGDPDGPKELHLVLIDNGRSAILESEYAEMLTCIRCGACLNSCPVYKLIGGHAYGSTYPGPMGSVISPLLYGTAPYADLPHASTLCGKCREVCPVRIDLPGMLLKLRRETVEAGHSPWWLRAGLAGFARVAGNPSLFQRGAAAAALASRAVSRGGWIGLLPPPLSAWTEKRDFPAFASKTFQQRWAERSAGWRGEAGDQGG